MVSDYMTLKKNQVLDFVISSKFMISGKVSDYMTLKKFVSDYMTLKVNL